jgi:DNA-binding CsgD family transcriptional regulator
VGSIHVEELKSISLSRILGFSCQRLWMAMMFYSIIPYVFSSDIRSTLYQHQTTSLFAFTVGCIAIIVFHKPHTRIKKADLLVWGSAALMLVGAILCFFADVTTPAGMLITTIASIATGLGSSINFIFWMRLFYSMGPIVTLVEYAAGSVVGLTVSLLLIFVPYPVSMTILALSPIGSAACLAHHVFVKRSTHHAPSRNEESLSASAKKLFIRALCGAFLIGFLQGFTDIVAGFSAFATTDEHGVYLFLVGILISLFLVFVGIIKSDPLETLYRSSMLFLCLGFVLMSFMQEYYTFYQSVSFGGYMIFLAFILLVSGRISFEFGTGIMRPSAASVGTLYLGEACGLVLGGGLTQVFGTDLSAEYISAGCVFVFLLVHLFLFNETDLVHAGIGDVDIVEGAALSSVTHKIEGPVNETPPDDQDKSDVFQGRANVLTQEHGLSPREAEVLLLLLQGRTMARIQEELYISAGTVSTHMRHIYQKIGVANKQQLLDLAFPKKKQEND